MELKFGEDYWSNRWENQETGWDIGHISTPLKKYFDQLNNKEIKILIPGAGNAYEAEYLHRNGFKNVFVADISSCAIESFKKRVIDFPSENILCVDYFQIEDQFELIIEQTFFCALHPSERKAYCKKTQELLRPKGKLVGLLFQIELFKDHPPFGGSKEEYLSLFKPYFSIESMETAYNSIEPRRGNEFFIKMRR